MTGKSKLPIETVEDLIGLVKALKFLGVTQFKIGDIAMDLTGDSYPTADPPEAADDPDEDLLYYSAK